MASESVSKSKYVEGEKILCFHGPLLYEAKCLNTKLNDQKEWLYQVHYQGWSKNWDEWVTDKRIYKFDENGLKKQAEIEQMVKSGRKLKPLKKSDIHKQTLTVEKAEEPDLPATIKAAISSTSAQNIDKDTKDFDKEKIKSSKSIASSTASNKKRKSRIGECPNEEPGILECVNLALTIPSNLKNWLIDDWDFLFTLPAKKPVSKILMDYLDIMNCKSEEKSNNLLKTESSLKQDLRNECVYGILLYFDTLLGSHLLYRFERLQYAEIYKQNADRKVSTVYGAPHLLRLFAKLSEFSSSLKAEAASISFLTSYINEILE